MKVSYPIFSALFFIAIIPLLASSGGSVSWIVGIYYGISVMWIVVIVYFNYDWEDISTELSGNKDCFVTVFIVSVITSAVLTVAFIENGDSATVRFVAGISFHLIFSAFFAVMFAASINWTVKAKNYLGAK